jgi:hypothetical protein
MKKLFFVLPIVATLAACSSMNPFKSTDPYMERVKVQNEYQDEMNNKILKATPDWCKEKQTVNNSVVYACGESSGIQKSFVEGNAKNIAFGDICMAAGGTVNAVTTTYQSENYGGAAVNSDRLIKSKCDGVDITGAEVAQVYTTAINGKFYSWAQVALPMGQANILRTNKVNEALARSAATGRTKAESEFKQ